MAILKVGFAADVDESEAGAQAEAVFRETYPNSGALAVAVIRTPDHAAAGEYLVRVEDVEVVADDGAASLPEV